MSAWIVYSKDGAEKCRVSSLEYNGEFLGACSVNLNIQSPTPIEFEIGDWIEYRGERFELNYDPSVIKESSANTYGEGFVYDNIVLNSLSDELTRCDFLDYVREDNGMHYSSLPTFSFYAESIDALAERIEVNLDRIYTGENKWTIEVHSEHINTKNVNISISNQTCWDALALVKSMFDANFIIRGRKIIIGTSGIAVGNLFSYGKGNGLYKIERNAESGQKIITRLRAYGSTRNLPSSYYKNIEGGNVPNNMAVRNLMLPSFPYSTLDPYIDSYNIEELGVREGTIFFDGSGDLEEIFPTLEGMTAESLKESGINVNATGELDIILSAEQIEDDGVIPEEGQGELKGSFTVELKDIGFDINDYLSTETAILSMKDGMCGGRDFEITKCEKITTGYRLTCNRQEDTGLGLAFPYNGYQIKAGDKFVLLNIEMPDVYVKAASQRLLAAAKDYLSKNDYVRYSYTPTIDNIWVARQHEEAIANNLVSIHDTIKEGDFILFEDKDLGIQGNITIDSLTIKENADDNIIPEYELTLKNEKTVGTIEKIQNQVSSIINGGGGSSMNTEQVSSIVKAIGSTLFLSKKKDDRSVGKIASDKGFEVGQFISGLFGKGANVDEEGRAELHSLFVRTFMEVPELRYNRVTVRMGDSITSCSAGIIKSVNILGETSGTIELKLEEGEVGTLEVGDIVFQIFSDMENKENNATETSDDGKGNRTIKGFATVMFKVTGVSGERNEIVAYSLRPLSDNWGTQVHPFQFGTFSQRGSFDNTKPERQVVIYEGIYPQPYTRYMFGVNDWEFTAKMIGMQLGDLSNLSVFGMDMTGYSAYLNNVYFTGQIRQLYIPQWMDGESSAQNGTLVFMGGDHYVSKGDTDNPPLFDLMDEDGNSLLFTGEDGEGNLLDLNSDEYDMLAKKGDDGVGIKNNVSYYLVSESSTKPSESSLEWSASMVQPTDFKPYLWKKTVITYTNLVKNTTIECISVRGKDGTSVSIKGSFDSEAALKSAYPNGPANPSDAYIVGGNLYVWTGAEWKNVGAIQGEKGDTAYIHLKYANETASGTQVNVGGSVVTLSFTSNDGEDMGDWMGIYTDHEFNESKNISDYKWKKIRGDKGVDSTSYWLESPVGTINFTTDGTPTPSSFVVSMKKKTGNGNVVACADFYLATWKYDGNWQLASISSVKTSSITVIPANTTVYKQYRVTAHTTKEALDSNMVHQIGIGVSFDGMKGDTGAEGIYVYDCGLFDPSREYFYQTVDGKVRRDKVVYEIGGGFYNFLVRSRQEDGTVGLVSTPPTSTQGDKNWEVMSQFQSLIANTVFGTNANIGGFMTSAERMISQTQNSDGEPLFELNGKNGTMTMRQSEGTVWALDGNGVQSVGNSEGERVVIDPNTRSISSFDANGVERTVIDGSEYTLNELTEATGGTVSLSSAANNQSGQTVSVSGLGNETARFELSSMMYSSVGTMSVSISRMEVRTVYSPQVNRAATVSSEYAATPFGEVNIHVETYETASSTKPLSRKLIATVSADGNINGGAVSSSSFQNISPVVIGKGYHKLVATVTAINGDMSGLTTVTGYWSVTSANISVESYVSRHFANGMFLSKSTSEYFLAMTDNGRMVVQMASGGNVYGWRNGSMTVNGVVQPMTVYAARVYDESRNQSDAPTRTELTKMQGGNVTITKLGNPSSYQMTFPPIYGLEQNNTFVNLVGYGYVAGSSEYVAKASLGSIQAASDGSMVLKVIVSDDETPNYGNFYIEVKKIM